MVAVLADPGLYAFTGGQPPSPDALRRRYAAQAVGRSADGSQWWLNWIVVRRRTDEAVGFVQATVRWLDGELVGDIAWVIGAGAQGEGVATEAAGAMLDWLRGQGVTRFVASIHPGHEASMGVARNCGLVASDEIVEGETRWTTGRGGPAVPPST
jgi:RimJ/RimL family protein N-acetyltransferase